MSGVPRVLAVCLLLSGCHTQQSADGSSDDDGFVAPTDGGASEDGAGATVAFTTVEAEATTNVTTGTVTQLVGLPTMSSVAQDPERAGDDRDHRALLDPRRAVGRRHEGDAVLTWTT